MPTAADGRLLLAGLLLGAVPAAAQDRHIDVESYHFAITVPDSGSEIRAQADLRVRRTPGFAGTLRLDLVGMTVDSARGPGGRPLPVASADSILAIDVGAGPGPCAITIWYHGTPRDGLVIGPTTRGERVVFGDNWPNRARFWLPTNDDPSDKAFVRFSVTAPSGWRVVSNGARHPIPTYTMVFGAGRFTVSNHRPVVHGRDTIPQQVWAYPEDSAFADSGPFRRATEIVEVMERLVGPFPYERLAHVESSTRYGGMENAGAIFYAERPYVARTMGEGVVRHETAHQWFGDAVTPRAWPHLWLSEGFATYFELVIGAALHGDTLLARGLADNAASYARSEVVDRPIVDTVERDPNRLLNANAYQKGGWVLHMLRGEIGDSAFFRGIRAYYRRYRDGAATSADFQRVMEGAAGRSLDWFFRQWLSQPGYPKLEYAWSYDAAARQVRLRIIQGQPPAWGSFRLPRLEIGLVTGSGTVRRTVALGAPEFSTVITLPDAPDDLIIDPDHRLLVQAKRIQDE